MQFDVKNFLLNAKTAYSTQFSVDLGGEDLNGSSLTAPAECVFTAQPTEEGALLSVHIRAQAQGECARCLANVQSSYDFTRAYSIRLRDPDDPDFELPMNENGCLDLRELVVQELIFEIPRVLLCSPDCPGLCPICGRKKAEGCTCQAAEATEPVDARLSILKQLLS